MKKKHSKQMENIEILTDDKYCEIYMKGYKQASKIVVENVLFRLLDEINGYAKKNKNCDESEIRNIVTIRLQFILKEHAKEINNNQ